MGKAVDNRENRKGKGLKAFPFSFGVMRLSRRYYYITFSPKLHTTSLVRFPVGSIQHYFPYYGTDGARTRYVLIARNQSIALKTV